MALGGNLGRLGKENLLVLLSSRWGTQALVMARGGLAVVRYQQWYLQGLCQTCPCHGKVSPVG